MLLARGLARQRELGTRLALGAPRARLVRQLITESIVLALPAVALGFAISWVAVDVGIRSLFATLPADLVAFVRPMPLHPDVRVFVFALIATVASALLFGVAPSLHATKLSVVDNDTWQDQFSGIATSAPQCPHRWPDCGVLVAADDLRHLAARGCQTRTNGHRPPNARRRFDRDRGAFARRRAGGAWHEPARRHDRRRRIVAARHAVSICGNHATRRFNDRGCDLQSCVRLVFRRVEHRNYQWSRLHPRRRAGGCGRDRERRDGPPTVAERQPSRPLGASSASQHRQPGRSAPSVSGRARHWHCARRRDPVCGGREGSGGDVFPDRSRCAGLLPARSGALGSGGGEASTRCGARARGAGRRRSHRQTRDVRRWSDLSVSRGVLGGADART